MRLSKMFDLTGKIAIVTGAGRGIGLKMAEALSEMGANVSICSRKLENCEKAARDLAKRGYKTAAMVCNVCSPDDIQKVVDETVQRFGSLDILINNSGVSWGATPEEYPLHGWKKVLDTNLNGVFWFSQIAGRVMIKQKGGNIINIASIMGITGMDPEAADAIGYSASKGAVITLTKDMAAKWAKFNIRVNALAPGWFPTDMSKWTLDNRGPKLLEHIPLRRFGRAEELKGAIIFLASEASSYVTGAVIPVDGGYLAI